MIIYSVSEGPASEPITLEEAKAWLKLDGTYEDTLITGLIAAARQICEAYSGLSFIEQVRTISLDNFCGRTLVLPYGPVTEVTSIEYVDPDDADQIIPDTDYTIDTKGKLSRIRVINSWPETNRSLNSITITYTAGYADAAAVPQVIKQAILMVLASLYENRQDEIVGSSANVMSWSSMALLDTVKVYWNAEA